MGQTKNIDRVILLLDVDCFSIQLFLQEHPELEGHPCILLQDSKISSISYEARALGIHRKLEVEDALSLCPDLHIFKLDNENEDLDPFKNFRAGSWNIASIVREYAIKQLKLTNDNIEQGSPDELYLDLTTAAIERAKLQNSPPQVDLKPPPIIYLEKEDKSAILTANDFTDDYQTQLLAHGGIIAQELCQQIYNDERSRFKCSGGIGQNKLLAKLACGLHRPNAVTVLAPGAIQRVNSVIKIEDITSLGGKTGEALKEKLNISTMRELLEVPYRTLLEFKGETFAKNVIELVNGRDETPVRAINVGSELHCRKRFLTETPVKHSEMVGIIRLLSKRMIGRLAEEEERNHRKPINLKISVTPGGSATLDVFPTRNLNWETIFNACMGQLNNIYQEYKAEPVKFVSICVKNFTPIS